MKLRPTLLIVLGAIAMASCNTKDCRCYELVGSHWTGPATTLANAGTPCSSLNSSTRKCNEMEDPILDSGDIAVGKKASNNR